MRHRWRHYREHQPAEMNITAFMNLMVILVPFLLITAVFSRLAVISLSLPSDDQLDNAEDNVEQPLKVIMRSGLIEVIERDGKRLVINSDNGSDIYRELGKYLVYSKSIYPDKKDAVILMDPDISYQSLIMAMDTIRVNKNYSGDLIINTELFPDISIGDAPEASRPDVKVK